MEIDFLEVEHAIYFAGELEKRYTLFDRAALVNACAEMVDKPVYEICGEWVVNLIKNEIDFFQRDIEFASRISLNDFSEAGIKIEVVKCYRYGNFKLKIDWGRASEVYTVYGQIQLREIVKLMFQRFERNMAAEMQIKASAAQS